VKTPSIEWTYAFLYHAEVKGLVNIGEQSVKKRRHNGNHSLSASNVSARPQVSLPTIFLAYRQVGLTAFGMAILQKIKASAALLFKVNAALLASQNPPDQRVIAAALRQAQKGTE
jgi:hypothetical protein